MIAAVDAVCGEDCVKPDRQMAGGTGVRKQRMAWIRGVLRVVARSSGMQRESRRNSELVSVWSNGGVRGTMFTGTWGRGLSDEPRVGGRRLYIPKLISRFSSC